MTTIKNKFIFIGIIIFCILALLFAFFVEYGLKHLPCNLCLIERIPYMATIILVSIVLILSKYEKIILVTIGLFFIIGTIVSFYHFGIEQGFFSESFVCKSKNLSETISKEQLLEELKQSAISCKDADFKIIGLSLASINGIFSLFLSVIFIKLFTKYGKN